MLKFECLEDYLFSLAFRVEERIESSLGVFFPLVFTQKRVISLYYQVVIEGTV